MTFGRLRTEEEQQSAWDTEILAARLLFVFCQSYLLVTQIGTIKIPS